MKLPAAFEETMKELLGTEYPEFLRCYEKEKKQGLRVNTGKISVEEFLKITPFTLTPIPWVKNGFFYREEDQVTKHPHYYAGLYYIQEPSAMVPASRLPVTPGEKVLDLCAAPGGKATELGAGLRGDGLLVANDVSISRARGLQKNLELFGISNALVTAETPAQLLKEFGSGYFDKVLVDAPCSGEGMFRKDPSLIRSWEERGPEYYAPLQQEILSCAAELTKPGGSLLYSTCTFSVEEDEKVICRILRDNPDLQLEQAEGYEGFGTGILSGEEVPERFDNEKCIRIWPHRMDGEGHFTVLLKKETETDPPAAPEMPKKQKAKKTQPSRKGGGGLPEEARCFLKRISLPCIQQGTFFQKNEELFLLPADLKLPALRYLRTGLHLGTLKKERFEPSQALAMALKKQEFDNVLDLPWDHPGVVRYLKGETLELPSERECNAGWTLICCDGYPLGWGKCVNGTIRNKYQPGWRMQ